MQLASLGLLYLIGVGVGIALILWARQFPSILRALLQSLGASIAALSLALVAFSFNPHELDVLIEDFWGDPLFMLGTPAAIISALWAMRNRGCLALGISAIAGAVLGGLGSLVVGRGLWLTGMIMTGNTRGQSYEQGITTEVFLSGLLFAVGLLWATIGMIKK